MKHLLCFFFFFFFTTTFCFAQQQYTITNYNEEQGLASGTILNMFKDNMGYLWLMSEEGLSRFDGYNFKVFRHNANDSTSIPDNSCYMGMQLANGDMFFNFFSLKPRLYEPEKLSFTRRFPYIDSCKFVFGSFLMKHDSNAHYIVTIDNLIRVSNSTARYFPFPVKNNTYYLTTASDTSGIIMTLVNKSVFAFNTTEKKYQQLILNDDTGKPDTTIVNIFYSTEEKTFVALSKKHFYRFNKEQNRFIPVYDLPQLSLLQNLELTSNYSWITPPIFRDYCFAFTTEGNLYKLNMKTGEEKIIHLNRLVPEEEITDKSFTACVIDKKGTLWLPSQGMGLFRFNIVSDEYQQFISNPGNNAGIPCNTVDYVLPDPEGVVWLACRGYGLVKMEPLNPVMESENPAAGNHKIVSGGDTHNIRAFVETGTGYLVGTLKGLYSYDATKKEFTEWTKMFARDENIIGSLAKDSSGNIWIATWLGQLVIVNSKTGKYISVQIPIMLFPNKGDRSWNIRQLFCDHNNTMWIATYGGGTFTVNANEIDFDNPAYVKFDNVMHDEKDASSISSNLVFAIAEDAAGNIWAGADNGLNCYNASTRKWKHYFNIPNDEHSISANTVRSFALDKKGTLWIGTLGGGLNRYNKKENNFSHFTMENGLPNNNIFSIVCDNNGMLWLGTNRGLCRFNLGNFSCTNFTFKDGIQNYEFNTGAALKLKDGTLLFGGVNGYNIIDPDKIEKSKTLPPAVVVSSIKIFDREMPPGNGSLKLNYNQNSLTFEFAALSFHRNQDNKYAYKLEPVETDWIYSNDRRLVSYSNLEPGDYIFKVKASNSDGVWNETGTQLSITITPPWWKTWWFRSAMLLLIISGTVWFFQNRTASLRKQKLVLENTVEQRTHDLREQKEIAEKQQMRAEQSEKFKQEFLANMSHEIRTPMNAVMGMTDLVLNSELNNKQRNYLSSVKNASENLLHIINDILDLSKVEAGKIELEQIDFSILDTIEQVKDVLQNKANEKSIELLISVGADVPEILIGDPLRLYQVLMNLAGNAIKFTDKGSVMIAIEKTANGKIKFSVIDTGIGIPKDKLENIFESFTQAHSSDSRKYGGTGLGLSISKQFIELMNGKLKVESEEGSGTTFSFAIDLPIGSKEKLIEQKLSEQIDGNILNGLRILLVDDNADNRIVARDTLESIASVTVTEATNGKEALDRLSENDFDVVLMDVQMPVMDGYEATRNIRKNFSSPKNAIPVIALTASVIRADLDKCRQAGMNDYVPKPFKTAQFISSIASVTGRKIKNARAAIEKPKAESARNNSTVTDLTYLQNFCEGNQVKMKKYIQMFLDSTPSFTEKMNSALAKNNFEEIASQVHGYKTKWVMMGMNEAKELAFKIESDCRTTAPDSSVIRKNTSALLALVEAAKLELSANHQL